jgi:hypothetical protein
MANKTFQYEVHYVNPDDLDLTPAKRRELSTSVSATSVPRAVSKAKKQILEDWEMEARDLVIVAVFRPGLDLD